MHFDDLQMFSKKQAVASTAVSENIIDLGADRDIAVGTDLAVAVCPVGTVSGTGTVRVEIQTSDSASMSSPKVIAATKELTVAELNDVQPIGIKFPYGAKRYLRLNYAVTSTVTGLAVTSGIVVAVPHDIKYPKATYA